MTPQTPEEDALARLLHDLVPSASSPVDFNKLRKRRRRQRRRNATFAVAVVLVAGAAIAGPLALPHDTHGGTPVSVGPAHHPSTAASPSASFGPGPANGTYTDNGGPPGYTMTIEDNAHGFSGTLVFDYEDGRTGEDYQYTATLTAPGEFTMNLSGGHTATGSFGQHSLTLADCAGYLSWANAAAHPGIPPMSCTFGSSS